MVEKVSLPVLCSAAISPAGRGYVMRKTPSIFLAMIIVLSTSGMSWARSETTLNRGAFYITAGAAATTASDILFSDAFDPTIVDVDFPLGDGQESNVALGFALWDGKIGLEYTAITLGDSGSDEFSASSIMLDGRIEKSLVGDLYYYLGAGIGAVTVSLDLLGEEDEIQRLAYKFKGGLMMDLGSFMSLDVGYSYLWGGDFDLETSLGTWSGNLITHGATAGISFYF
jgi:hypothetical protein